MEAAGLGLFMISACLFATVLHHPSSPVRQVIGDDVMRRMLMGLAMGATLIAIVYSPWGKQSGAHLNPSFTLTFFRLGKIAPWDAVFYVAAQFVGGLTGVMIMAFILGSALAEPPVHYVVTAPGPSGKAIAFLAEVVITFVMMSVVLLVSNAPNLGRFTGLFAGTLVAIYIAVEDPLSGMSMNPARSFASAVPARDWTALWIYFTAPPLGMLAAAQAYLCVKGPLGVSCAKLHHQNTKRCIFCAFHTKPEHNVQPRNADRSEHNLTNGLTPSAQVQFF